MIISKAERLVEVKEYYFSRKLKELKQRISQGEDIINLGIGSPDLPPSPETINALTNTASNNDIHGYQSYIGIDGLRENISQWYKRIYNVDLNPTNEILPLMGSKEGIMHISMAFLNSGDKVLVPNPGYLTYASVGKLLSAQIEYYDLKESNNWLPDFDALEKMDHSNTKIMWVNYPHMPKGKKADLNLFKSLIKFAKKNKILIINDNPYSLILNDLPLSILQVEGAKEVALELNSLSKSHNMAGWRVGMLSGDAEYIQNVLKVKSNMDSGMFRGIQEAAIAALNNTKEWQKSQNDIYKKRRKVCEEIMRELDCNFDPSQSGMFLWAKIPSWAENSEKFSNYILDNSGVFITPGFIFGSNGDRFIRISLCSSETILEDALQKVRFLFAIAKDCLREPQATAEASIR